MECRCRQTPRATERICRLVRRLARGVARRRHRRGVASHCRSRPRRTGQHRTAARLWARLSRVATLGPRLAHGGPQTPPAHRCAGLVAVAPRCAGPPCGLRGRPAPPCHFHRQQTTRGVNSSCRQGVNSGCRLTGGDQFFCGGGRSGKVRTVHRPRRGAAAWEPSTKPAAPSDR